MAGIFDSLPGWFPRTPRRRRGLSPLGSRGPGSLYRKVKSLELLVTRDRRALWSFLRARYPIDLSLGERLRLVHAFVAATNAVRCYHTQTEMLVVADAILARAGQSGLTVVEAGAGKGASTAKLSLATARAGGRLLVFDSFRGIPHNQERLTRIDGSRVEFRAGAFAGRLPTVRRNVQRFGVSEVCEFHKGWFEETMPKVGGAIDVVLLDVDLLSSTRTCLIHLFPRVRHGGVVFTQDGHLKEVIDLLGCESFWRQEIKVVPPVIEGLGRQKMLQIRPA